MLCIGICRCLRGALSGPNDRFKASLCELDSEFSFRDFPFLLRNFDIIDGVRILQKQLELCFGTRQESLSLLMELFSLSLLGARLAGVDRHLGLAVFALS